MKKHPKQFQREPFDRLSKSDKEKVWDAVVSVLKKEIRKTKAMTNEVRKWAKAVKAGAGSKQKKVAP